jgi:cytosine/adenosine deaminase-related metal-dependent hydrolase
VIELGPGRLRPGLINAHDHLHRNHYARIGSPPYPNAYAWGEDLHARWRRAIDQGALLSRREALLFGALKNLVAGVTTVVHHDVWRPELEAGFPVRIPRLRVAHSLRLEPDLAARQAGDGAPSNAPLCIHLAEGTDASSAAEVWEADRLGLLDDRLIPVHLVGVDPPGIERLRQSALPVVWCPSSNLFLFGRTAPRALIAGDGSVLLGSDSLLTGSGTLLDELREARALGYLSDDVLQEAVGSRAAVSLGLPAPSLDVGCAADLVLITRPLWEARARDIALVLVGGKPMLGEQRFAGLFERCGVTTELLDVGGVTKLVVSPLATVARRVFELSPDSARILE